MNLAYAIFGERLTEAIGWFLIHSLWQGALIALLLLVSAALLRKRSAQIRYYLSFIALILVVFSSALTFQKALNYADEKNKLKELIITQPELLKEYLGQEEIQQTLPKKIDRFSRARILIRSRIQQHFYWIVSLWILGLALYLFRILGGLYYQRRTLKAERHAPDPHWIEKLDEFVAKLNIRQRVQLFGSGIVKSPITTGFIKPIILLPISLLTGLTPEQFEAIIAHELAHIKRNDYLINIVQTLIDTVFFFHPGVWYISAQIRKERELACDDIALNLTKDPVAYAKALTLVQENDLYNGRFAMAFSPFRTTLLQRIKRLNKQITMKTNLSEKLIAGLLVISGIACLSFLIDGSYAYMKKDAENLYDEADSIAKQEPHKIIILKTKTDSAGKKVTTKQVYESKEDELDSLTVLMKEHGTPSDEAEKIFEVLLTEEDELLSDEIMRKIEITLKHLDEGDIEKSIAEVHTAFDNENIHIIIQDSMSELLSDSLELHTQLIVTEALGNAAEAMKTLEYEYKYIIDDVVDEKEMAKYIADAEIEMRKAEKEMRKAQIEMEIANREMRISEEEMRKAQKEKEMQDRYVITMNEELKKQKHDLYQQEMSLDEKEEALKIQLEKLEEELKEVKKQQKEEKKQK